MWYVINKNLLLHEDQKEKTAVPLYCGSNQMIIRCECCKSDYFRGFIKYSKDEIIKARSEKKVINERYDGDPRGQV